MISAVEEDKEEEQQGRVKVGFAILNKVTEEVSLISQHLTEALKQRSPTFLAPGTSFMEDNFFMDWGRSRGTVSG